jgi:outer membrane protein W
MLKMKMACKQILLGLLISSTTLPAFAANGFYAGLGASANSINENYSSTIFSSNSRSARDSYNVNSNQLAPMLQIGYRQPLPKNWLWGIVAQWKYLNYRTPNVDSSNGQHIANASFSSINYFGANIERDFASQTKLNNEFLLLFYIGYQMMQGYGYFGLGPAFITATNHVYLNSVHTPNATGDHLITTSVESNKTMCGGAAQLGYNYFITPSWFVNLNYTYLQTTNTGFNNTTNAAIYNGASTTGPTSLTLKRNITFSTQEVMLSVNKAF